MQQTIVRFEQDADGAWIAELSCGHRQHIRHSPPFELRPWVLTADSREARIGTVRDCPLCEESAAAGGESACFAHLVCDHCGVVLDGSPHAPDCDREGEADA